MRVVPIVCLILVLIATPLVAEEWSRFRGANGIGVSDSKGLPAEVGPDKNKIWSTEVPFGRSSPIFAGDRIYLTATDEGQFVTLALDRKTGKTLWSRSLEPSRKDEYHHDTDSASTTPATDGKNVYVFFQEFGLVSYDADGKQRWAHAMGPFRNFYSIAASPIVNGDLVYMLCDQVEDSFLVALNKDTGKEVWRAKRPGRVESYTTPILYPSAAEPEALIIYGSGWIDAYDPQTGKSLWAAPEVPVGPVPSPVLIGDTLYVVTINHAESPFPPFGGMLSEYDRNDDSKLDRDEVAEAWLIRHFGWLDFDADDKISEEDWTTIGNSMKSEHWGAYALRIKGGDQPTEKAWNYRRNLSEIASPLVDGGVFYMADKGILTSLDAKTGELIKRGRFGKGSPRVYASLVAADGKIFIGTLDGSLFVIRAAGEWKTLSSVDLGEEIWATPAIVDNKLYVRTRSKMYAFGTP